MQRLSSPFSPFALLQKTLMIIGALLFIALGSATILQTANPHAARNMNDPQPELKATAVFTR